MEKLVINGGKKLYGNLKVNSAKNAFLPILAACILCDNQVCLKNVPNFDDIKNMCKILQNLGAKIHKEQDNIIIDCQNIDGWELPESLTKLIRSSVFCLGSIVARNKKAKIAFPGGCAIGARPIDLHIKGLKQLGINIQEKDDYIYCETNKITANDIYLDIASVGATENLMLACCRADGVSHIYNCAKEPEIVDLQNFLNQLGFNVCGAGTDTITVVGTQNKTNSIEYCPISDRIIAGTYIIATAMTGGEIELSNINIQHIKILLEKIENNCCKTISFSDKIVVKAEGNPKSFGFIQTLPYPEFPTDLQAQMTALACVCKGNSLIVENMFETRFKHVEQLKKMGANITVDGKIAKIVGGTLKPNTVHATDLRCGACLVSAGLVALGQTTIYDIHHIDRGYANIEKEFSQLGADIKRIKIE